MCSFERSKLKTRNMRIYSLVLACFTLMASSAWAQCDNLFFSEAAEGSSNNKYLEIYNPTGADVDLSGYAFPSVSNAPTVVGEYEFWNAFPEGAMVAAGDVYIIAHPSSDATILGEADHTFTFLSNGDDGFILVQGNETSFIQVDAVGDWNGDPGSGWAVAGVPDATKDHTLVRKSAVQSGNAGDWITSAGSSEEDSEWIVLDQNDWSNLASHSFDGCGAAVPGCTNENAMNYNADATQDDGSCMFDNACNVDGVEVEASSFQYVPSSLSVEPGATVTWTNMGGTHDVNGDIDSQTGMSFGNPEAFYIAAVSGDASGVCIGSFTFNTPGVYTYDCSIGSHAALGMVATITVGTGGCTNAAAPNYNPSANFDDGSCIEVSTTSIADIQLGQETEAFTDSVVVTSGIVTGVFGSNVSIQDGQGAYSGIWLYAPDVPVMVGDAIEATGAVVEYFGKTQIGNPAVVITSQGNALPTPEVLATVDANAEAWEGVLIQVTGSVTNADLGFGEWALSDGSGDLAVDDAGYDAIGAGLVAANNQLQVTGALDYSFGVFKVQLRDAMDAQLYGCAVEGAANYNDLASIDDGSCVYEGGECGLFFSEMAEGSSNNKYIELYNPTQSPIFLSEYTLGNCSNGCDVTGEFDYLTFNFPAGDVVEAGSTYIIAHPSADSLILAVADMTYQYLSNGDDAFALLDITGESPVIVDVFGSLGADPGSGFAVAGVVNATQNATLVRKPTISQGNAGDWVTSAGSNELDSEWVINPSDYWTNLGIHTFQGACAVDNSGCTDSGAVNYDPSATEDDGSCIFIPNLTIQEIHGSDFSGTVVTSGVVTGVYGNSGSLGGQPSYAIQNGTGAFSGIWVIGDGVAVGDQIEVAGTVTVVYGLRQIQSAVPTVQSSGNALPAAEALASADMNDEQWESVLVSIAGECTSVNGFGEWQLNDGSGNGMVAGLGYDAVDDSVDVDGVMMGIVELGANYQVTGPNFYSFGNWKLSPRDTSDVVRVGCTDSNFPNYDALATSDDGSCVSIPGCTNPDADNYNPAATLDDGTCVIVGCTDPTALNYEANATQADDASCYYTLPSVIINEIHYNPCGAQGDDFDYEFVELLNIGDVTVDLSGYEFYNESAGDDQLSLMFPEGTSMAAGEFIVLVVSDAGLAAYGGNGYQVFVLDAGNFSNSGEAISLRDGFGNVVNAVDYNDAAPWPAASLGILGNNYVESPDGGCATLEYIPEVLDLFLTTPTANGNDFGGNWQASWVNNGTPGMANSSAFGCNNPAACNFNPNAILGNEAECEFDSCYGCTYVQSNNFDPNATVEDGSCEFTLDNPCPSDLNGDGSVSTADLLEFLAAFGSPC
jgi:plastocyanin